MKTSFPSPSAFLCVTAILMLSPALAGAQTEQPTPAPDPLAGIPVQVLDQQQVDLGDHIITLNRIAPPLLPTPTPTPPPLAANPAPSPPPEAEKPCKVVTFSVDQQNQFFTEVRGYKALKPELHARLNVDFRLLAGVSQLETSDAFYLYILALAFDLNDPSLPDPTLTLPEHASYTLTAGNPADHPDALNGLDALCAYFDAHRPQLIAEHRKRRDEAELRRNQPPTPTPPPPDAVINYWPVKSAVYPTAH